jgi:hypothetical protein
MTTKSDVQELRADVVRGMDFLDRNESGWYRRIDLVSLDMNSTEECVLGQLFDNAIDWGVDNDKSLQWMTQHGFWADTEHHERLYADLTDLWRAAVEERLLS